MASHSLIEYSTLNSDFREVRDSDLVLTAGGITQNYDGPFTFSCLIEHEKYIRRCIALSRNGRGWVAPNPMVGCVIVEQDRIIAEGWHREFGGPHAEVNALNAYPHDRLSPEAVVYVSLEPCAHHGKTPPCADVLLNKGARTVVIGARDPFPQVDGKGSERLEQAGVEVIGPILEAEVRANDPAFFFSIEKSRPYVTLKWARSIDGFIAPAEQPERTSFRLTSREVDVITHGWRAEHMAILVGSRTALMDNPSLDVRHVEGPSPIRLVLDRKGIVPKDSKLFDGKHRTIVFGGPGRQHVEHVPLENEDPLNVILDHCQSIGMRSILVEGGTELLQHFIDKGMWNEARIIHTDAKLDAGVAEPRMQRSTKERIEKYGKETIRTLYNGA